MIDIGVKRTSHYFSDYCSDCTRTFFIGEPTEFQKKIYNLVKEAHDIALSKVRAGIRAYTFHNLHKFLMK